MRAGPFQNILLKNLDVETIERLQLRAVQLPLLHDLETAGTSIAQVFFLEEGIASMTTRFRDGTQVETSMFGFDSVIGVSAFMGTKQSFNGIFMQLAGHGYASPVRVVRREFERCGRFQQLALRYVQRQLVLSTQNAACNAMHTYDQRLARWLLICRDRAGQDHIEMAQDFVSEMLGSARSTVSIAASALKAKGLIRYSRGVIQILDGQALEAEACECYRVVRDHLESFAEFETGTTD